MIRPRELSRDVALFAARTPTLPPATHTNSYALGSRDVIVVEPATPFDDERQAFAEWIRGLPSQGRRAVAMFATHHHPDHVGTIDLARELGLPLWMHAETAARLPGVVCDRALADGDELALDGPVPTVWTALHTPGHAAGHVCLWEKTQRTLIAGDMVASVGTILIAPGEGHMRTYLAQLARLEALDARLALPAHGEPIDAPSALFRRYIEHRGLREQKVRAAVSAGEGTLADLVALAYDDTPPSIWPFAMMSLEAHLVKLVEDGEVTLRDGRYRADSTAQRT